MDDTRLEPTSDVMAKTGISNPDSTQDSTLDTRIPVSAGSDTDLASLLAALANLNPADRQALMERFGK